MLVVVILGAVKPKRCCRGGLEGAVRAGERENGLGGKRIEMC